LTTLTIVAAAVALIVTPTRAADETDLRGFVAGDAIISTSVTQSLEITAAVGIPVTSQVNICHAPPATDLNEAVAAFEAAAAAYGFRTTIREETIEIVIIHFTTENKVNRVVRSFSRLCNSMRAD
jgi:hypothetical protein